MSHAEDDLEALFRRARRQEDPSPDDRRAVRLALTSQLGAAALAATVGVATQSAAASSTAVAAGAATGSAGATTGTGAALAGSSAATGALGSAVGAGAAAGAGAGLALKTSMVTTSALWLLAGAGVGTAVSFGVVEGTRSSAPAAVEVRPPPSGRRAPPSASQTARAPRPATVHQTAQPGTPVNTETAEPAYASPTRARALGTTHATATPSLAEEARALADVQRALRDGDPERALALLDAQERRLPSGKLHAERAAARVLALCAAGRLQEGRAAAARFLSQHPSSPLSERIRSSCGS